MHYRLLPALFAGCLAVLALPAMGEVMEVRRWPEDISLLPCEAWRHNPDGSWTSTVTLRMGEAEIDGFTARSPAERRLIEARCRPH